MSALCTTVVLGSVLILGEASDRSHDCSDPAHGYGCWDHDFCPHGWQWKYCKVHKMHDSCTEEMDSVSSEEEWNAKCDARRDQCRYLGKV